jgi:hypothetical protein
VPESSQITTVDAPISISESRVNPVSATDRAEIAAMASTTIPATFHASVAYSSAKPQRSSARRTWSWAAATAAVCQRPAPALRRPATQAQHKHGETAPGTASFPGRSGVI